MITIYGKYTNAIVYTTNNEEYAIEDDEKQHSTAVFLEKRDYHCNEPKHPKHLGDYEACAHQIRLRFTIIKCFVL